MKIFDYLFYATISIMAIVVILNNIAYTNYYSKQQIDEIVYKDTITRWSANGTQGLTEAYMNGENKPVTFLSIQRVLEATPLKTRALNLILIGINTGLIFRYTKRFEAFFYPIIPLFLNSMWLTVEIIETLFIILAIMYQRYQGIFVGLATIFRPYALVYSILAKKEQIKYIVLMLIAFAVILYSMGLLFVYPTTLINYGSTTSAANLTGSDYIALMLLGVFAILGLNNKTLFKYGLVAAIPLIFRLWAHYFIPSYSLFFIGYLKPEKSI